MTLPSNKSLPARLRAGDAHAWNVAGLPPALVVFYVMTASIAGTPARQYLGGDGSATSANGVTTYDGITVPTNGTAAFVLASADTVNWAPGRYQWVLFSVDPANGNRTEIAQGQIRIAANPTGTSPADPRSYNQQVLDQIRTVIQGTTLDDTQMFKIGGRELTKIPRFELMKLEGIFAARVRAERRRRGEFVPTKTVGITFGGR